MLSIYLLYPAVQFAYMICSKSIANCSVPITFVGKFVVSKKKVHRVIELLCIIFCILKYIKVSGFPLKFRVQLL